MGLRNDLFLWKPGWLVDHFSETHGVSEGGLWRALWVKSYKKAWNGHSRHGDHSPHVTSRVLHLWRVHEGRLAAS